MARFLYWNMNGKALPDLVAALAAEADAELFVAIEPPADVTSLIEQLKRRTGRQYVRPFSQVNDILLLTTFPTERVETVVDDGRLTIRRVTPPAGSSFLLVLVHYGSKRELSDDEQALLAPRLAQRIAETEKEEGHTRTVLVGDLNMNPFELAVVNSEGLHAISDRVKASKGSRVVHGITRRFFYNPSWALLGNGRTGGRGTCFYNRSGRPVNYYWNVFDQVLIRPDLLSSFDDASLRVVTGTREHPSLLLTPSGHPDRARFSDHLPLAFDLETERSAAHANVA